MVATDVATVRPAESPALTRWKARTGGPLTVLAIGSLPFMLLHFHSSRLHRADRVFLFSLDVVLFVAFTVDYVVELVLSADRRRFVRSEKLALVIVLSQLASLFHGLAGIGALRSLRVVRPVVSIARAVSLSGVTTGSGRALLRRDAARFAIGVAGFTWASAGVGFVMVVRAGDHSISDGLWWSLTTMTTVGYGDLYPVTPGGRVIGAITMVVGVAALAVVTAKIAEYLVRTRADGTEELAEADPAS